VVECWGEPRPKGRDWCIDHIDENKTNNKVENLRWLPRSENTRRSQIGKSNPRKAVVQMESEVKEEIVNLSNQGLSQRQIADIMGKSQRSIWNVLNGVY
jgi:DNA-directed RNA polymerase specialized sigma24 family protein